MFLYLTFVLILLANDAFAHSGSVRAVTSLPSVPKLSERQYTGYLPTRPGDDESSLFYWFFESRSDPKNDPIILWLQGGPGCSGGIGLFQELGPYLLNGDLSLSYNSFGWNSNASLIMIDQPLGTGFSFNKNYSLYIHDEKQMAEELHFALINFFGLFPELRNNNFFIAGESYAGKYIPFLATEIMNFNSNQTSPIEEKINLVGMAIGDGWTDPLTQTEVYPDQAYNLGLIDELQLDNVKQQVSLCADYTNAKNWSQAQIVCDNALAYIVNASGGINEDDVREFGSDDKDDRLTKFHNLNELRDSLGLPLADPTDNFTVWSECNTDVAVNLYDDEMKSAVHLLPDLYNNYRVLLYVGQFDLNCGVPGVEAYLNKLIPEYHSIPRRFWKVSNNIESNQNGQSINGKKISEKIAGYIKEINDNLTFLIVSGAGHLVPKTQSFNAHSMILNFISNRPL